MIFNKKNKLGKHSITEKMTQQQNDPTTAYISQLTPMEQTVLQIAKSHLETSFSLTKSIGFQEWQAEQTLLAEQTLVAEQLKKTLVAEQLEQTLVAVVQRKIKIKKKLIAPVI